MLSLVDVDRNFADGLHAVGVEENAVLAADFADFGDGLEHADFVVGVHDGDENRLIGDRFPQHVEIDQAVALHRQIGDPIAVLFELLAGIENGFVLGGGGDDVVAFFGIHLGHALDGEVVRFGGAAGEDDFARRGADQIGNLLARFIHRLLGHPAELVIAAGGIAEVLREIGQHRLEDAGVHLRGRVIVEINGRLHLFFSS